MSKDFTLFTLKSLYQSYLNANFTPQTFENFLIEGPAPSTIIFRHDVDSKPQNSLRVAQLQHSMGIRGTFYFRIAPESYHVNILKEIAMLGHEIGYHYEDVTLCKGNLEKAAAHFEKTLDQFRKHYPVRTICMHGSPLSKWDNRTLWKKINYKDFGIAGEPYFDLNLSNGIYITDTGRMWDGDKYSIRDRIKSGHEFVFKTTFEIINAIVESKMPPLVMMNFHPQRWTNNNFEWLQELLSQRAKNVAKNLLRKIRK